jgi:hypothetical protein
MTIDRQVVAEHVWQLRATLPATGDLLAGLQRVTEATRAVVRVDGAGLTLVHDDGRPQWVAVSDAAMELLEQVQHDFGEGHAWPPSRRTASSPSRTLPPRLAGTGSPPWSAGCRCVGC